MHNSNFSGQTDSEVSAKVLAFNLEKINTDRLFRQSPEDNYPREIHVVRRELGHYFTGLAFQAYATGDDFTGDSYAAAATRHYLQAEMLRQGSPKIPLPHL